MIDSVHAQTLPNRAGIALKLQHLNRFLRDKPDIGFVEVHAENYLVEGGMPGTVGGGSRRLSALHSRSRRLPGVG